MLLATKLFVPRPHQARIRRGRLETNLDEIARRRLTLVSAPAGFGKTTLVASWLEASGLPIAWISLDSGDNDLHRFLSYLVAALQRISPGIGQQVEQALATTAPLPSETMLAWLVNDLATVTDDFILVLDDYHTIESEAVHQALLFLLEYGPPSLHIVATTRVDPPIPIARFRVRGELLELRATDLRFSSDEAREFFDVTMHLSISGDQLEALQAKTEGWIAGLQMAALSLEGREDIDGFITAFTGADRYVLDYLIEEVLSRQPAELVKVMLDLSVLDRFNGALVEAVTGSSDGSALLEQIERANLFLIPLDSRREWYRYHHLFGDLLRHRLQQGRPDSIAEIHRRASDWFEEEGEILDTVIHALASRDSELLIRRLERHWRSVLKESDQEEVLGMFVPLDDRQVEASPRLCMLRCWPLYHDRRFDEAYRLLDLAERGAQSQPEANDTADILGQAAMLRAAMARESADTPTLIEMAGRALELLPNRPDDSPDFLPYASRRIVLSLLGSAHEYSGDYRRCRESFFAALNESRGGGDESGTMTSLSNVARADLMLGMLGDADLRGREMLAMSASPSFGIVGMSSAPHHIRARVCGERNELPEALEAITTGLAVCGPRPVSLRIDLLRTKLLIQIGMKDFDQAHVTLQEIENLPIPAPDKRLELVGPMLRATLDLAQGNIERPLKWAATTFGDSPEGPDPTDFLPTVAWQTFYGTRLLQMVYARILIASGRESTALRLLAILQDDLERAGLLPLLLETLVLSAIARQNLGEIEAAIELLEQALRLGAPERFVRVFAVEGEQMARLVLNHQRRRSRRRVVWPDGYLEQIAAACGVGQEQSAPPETKIGRGTEALTPRELDILQLIAAGHPNRKIAEKLYVSVNTVKTHMSNLFDKLGASSRVEALVKAKKEGVLE